MKDCITTITIPRYFCDEEIDKLHTLLEHEYNINRDDVKIVQISNDVKFDKDYNSNITNQKSFMYKKKYGYIIHITYLSAIGILIYNELYPFMMFGFIFYALWLFGFALENSDNK